MDVNKVLYVSQEISPYLPDSPMSIAGLELPKGMQERGMEVRTFMPKYGCINERRNQLHEVIRLSGMNLIIDDTDHPLIIKVATLQPSRMQVYFIFNEDYFTSSVTRELETDTFPDDNDERSIFFVRGVLETVRKLRWEPDIIQCSGWVTALAPLYIRKFYGDDPSFIHSKVVYALFDNDFETPFNKRLAEKLMMDGMSEDDVKPVKGKRARNLELTKLALRHSDAVIQCSPAIDPEVLKAVEKSKLPFLPYTEDMVAACAEFYKTL